MSTDSSKTLNVGVIGVGSPQSWAREAHVTAVTAAPGLELLAVATRDRDSAASAARQLGARRGYGDALELINDDDVDIVTVGAPVPAHRELILAALEAGKHVVTEWPVGTGTAQTEEISAAAAASAVHTAVGLQSRMSPAVVRARELLAAGAVGRVLTVSVYSSTAAFGAVVPKQALRLEDPATGMNLTTIQGAHTMDVAVHLAGSLTSLTALRTVRFPTVKVTGSSGKEEETFLRTVPDHVLVNGRLAGGGALAVQVAGGRPAGDSPFRMDIDGESGSLTLKGGGPRGFQASALTLRRDGKTVDIPDRLGESLPDSVVNVAHLYDALAKDISSGSAAVPGFGDAVVLSHLIDDLIASDRDGTRVTPSPSRP